MRFCRRDEGASFGVPDLNRSVHAPEQNEPIIRRIGNNGRALRSERLESAEVRPTPEMDRPGQSVRLPPIYGESGGVGRESESEYSIHHLWQSPNAVPVERIPKFHLPPAISL